MQVLRRNLILFNSFILPFQLIIYAGTKKVSMIVSYWEDNAKIIRIDNDIFPSHQRVIDGKVWEVQKVLDDI